MNAASRVPLMPPPQLWANLRGTHAHAFVFP
jgi:hypothetical protein